MRTARSRTSAEKEVFLFPDSIAPYSQQLGPPANPGRFTLFDLKDEVAGIAKAIPVRHLSPSDDRSLIIRHHWSESLANAYLQGVEDMDPDQPCGGVYTGIFTNAQSQT